MNAVLNKIPKSTMIIILIVLTLTVISVASVFLIKTYGIYAWSAEGKIINEVYAVSVGDKELGLTATKDDADKVAERLKGENTPEGISQVTTNVKIRIAVLVSQGGTNLQALIDAEKAGIINSGKIQVVISNNKDAYALKRAQNAGIRSYNISNEEDKSIESEILNIQIGRAHV